MRLRGSLLLSGAVLVALSLAVAHWARPSREWTTGSARAARLHAEGEQLLRAFRWQEAERSLAAALTADPDFAMARAAHAEVLAALGERERSRRAAFVADSLARRLGDAAERAAVQLRAGALDATLSADRESLMVVLEKRRPDCLVLAVARARLAERRRDAAAEEAAWREVLRLDPNYALAWNQLGYLAARQGRYADAESHLLKYAYLAPDLANPHDSLGDILAQQGKYERAEAELRKSLALQPDFFPSLLLLGQVYVERGQIAKGVQLLEKVREQIAGTDWERRVDGVLIRTYRDHDLREALLGAVRRWIASYPGNWQTPYFRAVELALLGHAAEARAACAAFAATEPQESWYDGSAQARAIVSGLALHCRGLLALEAGQPDSAAAHFTAALAVRRDDAPSETWSLRLLLAESLLRADRPADALAAAREVLAVNPRRLRALALETRALLVLERTDEARDAYARLRGALAAADPEVAAAFAQTPWARALGAVAPRPPA